MLGAKAAEKNAKKVTDPVEVEVELQKDARVVDAHTEWVRSRELGAGGRQALSLLVVGWKKGQGQGEGVG